jgi:hypothetical protein
VFYVDDLTIIAKIKHLPRRLHGVEYIAGRTPQGPQVPLQSKDKLECY